MLRKHAVDTPLECAGDIIDGDDDGKKHVNIQ